LISANVQIGAVLLCKGAKVKPEVGLGPGLGLEIREARRLGGPEVVIKPSGIGGRVMVMPIRCGHAALQGVPWK
jgi:hypothetical protein